MRPRSANLLGALGTMADFTQLTELGHHTVADAFDQRRNVILA